MTVYLTVAAVRIQEWLVRTPRLTLLRGASAALNAGTSAAAVETHLAALTIPSAMLCVDAGDVDGVVVVEIPSMAAGRDVAARLATALSAKLPAVEWQAWWTDAPSYVQAFRKVVILDQQDGVGRSSHQPALLDTPVAESCPGCRREISLDPTENKRTARADSSDRLGPDCRSRDRHKGESRKSWAGLPGKPAHEFEHLARHGGVNPDGRRGTIGRRDSANHLATIAADGNRVGAFFEAVATNGTDKLRSGAVKALTRATQDAVSQSVKALADKPTVMAAIPHLVGGDDVLISVPAPLGWQFVAALSGEFRTALDREFAPLWTHRADETTIREFFTGMSLGIGMIFAHSSHPFADAQSLAHDAMKHAKQAKKGQQSAVTWLDLTAENSIPPGRSVLSAEIHDQLVPGMHPGLFNLGNSARAVLAGMLRDLWADGDDFDAVSETVQSVRRWSRRTNTTGLPAGLNSKDAPGGADALCELRDLLSRARWWPTVETAAQESRSAS